MRINKGRQGKVREVTVGLRGSLGKTNRENTP